MSTGREAFSLLVNLCLDATSRFVLQPNVFFYTKVHFQLTCVAQKHLCFTSGGGGRGLLTSSRLIGSCMCCWMGLHFHDCIDYYGGQKILACENSRFSSLLAAGEVLRGGMFVTWWPKFYSDDINQSLHNKSGSHGFPGEMSVFAG